MIHAFLNFLTWIRHMIDNIICDMYVNMKTYIVSLVVGLFNFFNTPKILLDVVQVNKEVTDAVQWGFAENLIRLFWAVITVIVITIVSFFLKIKD